MTGLGMGGRNVASRIGRIYSGRHPDVPVLDSQRCAGEEAGSRGRTSVLTRALDKMQFEPAGTSA